MVIHLQFLSFCPFGLMISQSTTNTAINTIDKRNQDVTVKKKNVNIEAKVIVEKGLSFNFLGLTMVSKLELALVDGIKRCI